MRSLKKNGGQSGSNNSNQSIVHIEEKTGDGSENGGHVGRKSIPSYQGKTFVSDSSSGSDSSSVSDSSYYSLTLSSAKGDSSGSDASTHGPSGEASTPPEDPPNALSSYLACSSHFFWGSAAGCFASVSAITMYGLSTLYGPIIRQLEWSSILKQFDNMNYINWLNNIFPDNASVSNFITSNDGWSFSGRTLLGYGSFILATSFVFGVANTVYRSIQRCRKSSEGFQPLEEDKNIAALLFHAAVIEKKLDFGTYQNSLILALNFGFIFVNALYDIAYLDVGGDAVDLLPTFGGLSSGLNQYAGSLSYFMNFVLDLYFALLVTKTFTNKWNETELIRELFTKEGKYSRKTGLIEAGKVLSLSSFASVPFIVLAIIDTKLQAQSWPIRWAVILSAYPVFALVLKVIGSEALLEQIYKVGNWLNSFPKPLSDAHEKYKTYRGHILGWALYSTKEFGLELGFLVLGSPRLIPAYTEKDKPEATFKEIKEAVEKRID